MGEKRNACSVTAGRSHVGDLLVRQMGRVRLKSSAHSRADHEGSDGE
jgi:hypothetical protein